MQSNITKVETLLQSWREINNFVIRFYILGNTVTLPRHTDNSPNKFIFKETTRRETLLQAPKRLRDFHLQLVKMTIRRKRWTPTFSECVKTKSNPGRHSVSCLTVSEPLFAYQNTEQMLKPPPFVYREPLLPPPLVMGRSRTNPF